MAMHWSRYTLIILINLALAFATRNLTSNEACVGDGVTITLSFGVYKDSCPEAEAIVYSWVNKAMADDPRMAASLLRLHFHDCIGCDASVLLDDTPNFVGEKTAAPNANSLRGFELIDAIKSDIESLCPGVVSCADILTIAARDSVVLSGGPGWQVETGRMDSLTASKTAANNDIPGPNSDVQTLVSKFQAAGLELNDMVTLSGAHTMGKARCTTFISRLNGTTDSSGANGPDVNLDFISSLQQLCLASDANAALAQLDLVTPSTFDNQYYVNLISGEGLLTSDQVLVTGDEQTDELVRLYADDQDIFFEEFRRSMIRMGRLQAAGNIGEIRKNCRAVN
ncbi:Peroxidase [Heracleum sosnowskyi]|uniref:Peroxidase n=1 Tax=Heracleum sosnowskyi TaxID=360622 RepID=A0AAD8MWE7_9APIA|nr:Peroxidase [Heracleum sosnowskyi]